MSLDLFYLRFYENTVRAMQSVEFVRSCLLLSQYVLTCASYLVQRELVFSIYLGFYSKQGMIVRLIFLKKSSIKLNKTSCTDVFLM